LLPLWIFAAVFYVAHAPVFHAPRYSLPLVIPLAAAGGALLHWAGEGRKTRGAPAWRPLASYAAFLLVGVAAVWGAVNSVRFALELEGQQPRQILELAPVVESARQPGDRPVVLSRKPHFAWECGGDWESLGKAQELPELLERARETKADYLFFSWPEVMTRPHYGFLLIPEFAPPGLVFLAQSPDGLASLYQVTDSLATPDWSPEGLDWRNAEAMAKVQPENLEALRLAGRGRHAAGDLDRAATLYREVLIREPQDIATLVELGKVLLLQGRNDSARRLFGGAIERGHQNPDLWRGIGEAAFREGDLSTAQRALERYLTVRDDPAARILLDQIRARAGSGPGDGEETR
jgi:tetratricopeptide (TPR) repeat protein